MAKRYFYIVLIFTFFVVSPLQTYAQQEGQDEAALQEQTEAAQAVYDMTSELMKKLEERDQQHFFMTYSNYNLIETVKVVRGDVSNAINECSKNNPDMESELRGRFQAWNGAVDPLLDEAKGNLNNMVIAQDYVPEKDIRAIFNAIDTARKETSARMEKVPVTTQEACEYLLEKMDETQESMVSILRSTLVSFPQTFPDEAAGGNDL